MKQVETITSGNNTFEIVDEFPLGYRIWNIGKNMPDGYLPLCRPIPGTYNVEPDTLKALKLESAQVILAAIGHGCNTIAKMERFVQKHQDADPGSWEYRQVQRIQKALPEMRKIPYCP